MQTHTHAHTHKYIHKHDYYCGGQSLRQCSYRYRTTCLIKEEHCMLGTSELESPDSCFLIGLLDACATCMHWELKQFSWWNVCTTLGLPTVFSITVGILSWIALTCRYISVSYISPSQWFSVQPADLSAGGQNAIFLLFIMWLALLACVAHST